jgi:hypothetical protein
LTRIDEDEDDNEDDDDDNDRLATIIAELTEEAQYDCVLPAGVQKVTRRVPGSGIRARITSGS